MLNRMECERSGNGMLVKVADLTAAASTGPVMHNLNIFACILNACQIHF